MNDQHQTPAEIAIGLMVSVLEECVGQVDGSRLERCDQPIYVRAGGPDAISERVNAVACFFSGDKPPIPRLCGGRVIVVGLSDDGKTVCLAAGVAPSPRLPFIGEVNNDVFIKQRAETIDYPRALDIVRKALIQTLPHLAEQP